MWLSTILKLFMLAATEYPQLMELASKMFAEKRTVPREEEIADLDAAEVERRSADQQLG